MNSTISYIVTNKALSGRTKSIEVSTLPLLSGRNPGKEEKRVSAVQERLYKSKTAPPMETSMIILRELHRVATVEIESSPYADSSSQKGRMTTVYCDFSVTHMEQISDLLLFLSTWVTDSSSNSKKGDKVGLLLSLRWTLSLCTQCVLQCAQKQISEQMKSAVSNMMDILYDKVMIPCRTAWLKFPLLREEIQTSCVKILFAAPGLYFLECNKVEYARTLLIRAFQRNDTPFINVVSKLWSVNPSHSWLELAGAILRSGDGPIPFFDVLVKSCTGADSKNLSAITGVAGPRISSNLNVLLCFHKVFLSQAFANVAAVATPSSAARSVKVLYSPKYYLIYLLAVLAILFQPAFSITDTSSPTDKGTVLGIVYSIQLTQTMGFFEAIFYWGPNSLDWTIPTWFGLAFAVGGLALRSWAYNSLGKVFTWHIDPSQADAVYRDGPYKIVRHPSYTGAYFLYFGTLLIMGAWGAAAISVVAMYWALARRIHFEEIALTEKFGDSYGSFQKEVGAVLPGLGKK